MLRALRIWIAAGALAAGVSFGQPARSATGTGLAIVADGQPMASVVISASATEMERFAAADLVKYVQMMTGATLPVLSVAPGSRPPAGPALVVGEAALAEDASLARRLREVSKKNPIVGADAIVIRRTGDRVYLAGSNDRSHYFAVSKLLQDWGCRWYLPTEFGEVVPEQRSLEVGAVDYAYGSPFEIRNYWLSWRGDSIGQQEFQRRNFANASKLPLFGHALGRYTKALVPPGKTMYNVPLSEPETALEVARQVEAEYAKGVPGISLAIEDGLYTNDSASDAALQARIVDKYMITYSNSDAMVALYNGVSRILKEKYPDSPTKIGGLVYSNLTLPPQTVTHIEPNVVMWLAPIDIDPNHGMDDPRSPPRQEYKSIMYRWADLLKGRLAIHDYDQGQLVWRDLPNPSQHVFAQDVRHYRQAGILGLNTESRGAAGTTFLNLFFRLQLMWNPDADVDALLAEFYPKFYGPAAGPMADYWNAIFAAWKNTIVTEHEFFIAPAIYTPDLVDRLGRSLAAAQAAVAPLQAKGALTRNEKLYLERMRFTELSYGVIRNYMAMVHAAATDGEYAKAVAAGERTLAVREQLTDLNPTFTNYKGMGEKGNAWLPAEVGQMRELAALTGGPKGSLVVRTPLEWSFRPDPNDTGLARGWAYTPARVAAASGDPWQTLRTDLYLQAQGVLMPDAQSYLGYWWYQTEIDLGARQSQGPVHIMFPGLFNQAWLYVNGRLVGYRPVKEPWWRTDYRFEWDVDLTGHLQPGKNLVTVRGLTIHHFGGMFRRPFLYRAAAQ